MMVIVRLASVFFISSFPSLQFVPCKLVFIKSVPFNHFVAFLNMHITQSTALLRIFTWFVCFEELRSNAMVEQSPLFYNICKKQVYVASGHVSAEALHILCYTKLHRYCIYIMLRKLQNENQCIPEIMLNQVIFQDHY